MLKHTALIALLTFGIGIPAVAAQTADGAGPGRRGPLQKLVQLQRRRVVRGVRAGRITSDELARLQADAAAVRGQVQALRQAGTPPTHADRRQVRQAIRALAREIRVANHRRRPR